jgi:hypothetical protein
LSPFSSTSFSSTSGPLRSIQLITHLLIEPQRRLQALKPRGQLVAVALADAVLLVTEMLLLLALLLVPLCMLLLLWLCVLQLLRRWLLLLHI